MKNNLKAIVMFAMIIMTATMANAQFTLGGPGTSTSVFAANGTTATTTPTVPFDGGMSLMLAASGIGYVAKRMKRKN